MHYIYKITNKINGKSYIGQTNDIYRRWQAHKNAASKNKPEQVIHYALMKHGIDNFEFECLASCRSWEDTNELETIIVAQTNSLLPYGYNNTKGGFNSPKTEEWKNKVSKSLTSSLDKFLLRANEIHGIEYDYSESVYVSAKTPIKIICKTHGPFLQKPDKHLNAQQGCPHCAHKTQGLNKSKSSASLFVNKAINVHGNKYNYSETEYIKATLKVKIYCLFHRECFYQTPNNHLNGYGCPKCGIEFGSVKKRN